MEELRSIDNLNTLVGQLEKYGVIKFDQMAIENNPFDHILYEFSMYLGTSFAIMPEDAFLVNLIVDSRMVHMRNLAYFFCNANDKKKLKKCMHYSDYIDANNCLELSSALYDEIQNITCNSTLHMLKGRIDEKIKTKANIFTISLQPKMIELIKRFIQEADLKIHEQHYEEWNCKQIQERVAVIRNTIESIETK